LKKATPVRPRSLSTFAPDLRDVARTARRTERTYHGKKLCKIVGDIGERNSLQLRMDERLDNTPEDYIDQTRESDLHFLTRLAKKHDAVATVKKGRLVFKP